MGPLLHLRQLRQKAIGEFVVAGGDVKGLAQRQPLG
jgi:hypothetical protein